MAVARQAGPDSEQVLPGNAQPLLEAAIAVVTRTEGPMVAVLDGQQTVRYRKVQLGRDYGAEVEVVAGLSDGENVVVHSGDDLPEGVAVEAVAVAAK